MGTTNFIKNFLLKNPQSTLSNGSPSIGLGRVSGTQLLELLNDASSYLSNATQLNAELLPSLFSSVELCPSNPDISARIADNPFNDYQCEVSQDTAHLILDAIENTTDFNNQVRGSDAAYYGFTLTNAEGYAFEFIKLDSPIQIDNVLIVVSTCITPTSQKDAFLYKIGDEWFVNTLVRSKGFWRDGFVLQQDATIFDTFMAVLDWGEFGYTGSSIGDGLEYIAYDLTGTTASSIIGNINLILAHYDLESSGTIYGDLLAILYHLHDLYAQEDIGIEAFYPDIISDVMESDAINQVLLEAVDELKHGRFSASNFVSSCDKVLPEQRSSVKRVISTICGAFTSGGALAAARTILDMITRGTNVFLGDDGSLQFTDNSVLVPQQYIAGMICNILGAVAAVAGVIVSIFSRVAGILISLAGSALLAIPKAIKYDYNTATNARIVGMDDIFTGAKAILPIFPHGLWQTEMPKAWCNAVYRQMFNDGFSGFMLNIPGGYLIVGPSTNADNIRIEFHPAVANFSFDSFGGGDYITKYWNSSTSQYTQRAWAWSFVEPYETMFSLNHIFRAWSRANPLYINFNSEGYVQDPTDDLRLRVTFMRNMSLAYSYLCLVSNEYEWRTSWLYGNSALLGMEQISAGPDTHIMKWFLNETNDAVLGRLYGNKRNFNVIPYLGFSLGDFVRMAFGTYFDDMEGSSAADKRAMNTFVSSNIDLIVPSWSDLATIAEYTNTNYDDDHLLRFETMTIPHGYWSSGSALSLEYATVGLPHSGTNFMGRRDFYGNVLDIPDSFSYLIETPKYDKSTFLFWVGLVTVVSVIATVVTVIAAVKVKKTIAMKQAMHAAKTEAAWQKCATEGATPENVKAYRSAVFKNNMFAKVTGGTKYSKTGFWNDADASSSENSGSILDSLLQGNDDTSVTGSVEDSQDLNRIIQLISGPIE